MSTVAIGVGLGIIGIAATPMLLGFGMGGVAAGSVAAGIQAGIGNVAAGSIFSTLTSLGMTGVFAKLATVGGAILAGGALL